MTDDDLRDRMRRADPAASLRPLPDDETRRLVSGAALTMPAEHLPAGHMTTGRNLYTRRVLVLVGAAAAVALAAGAVVLADGDRSVPRPVENVALPPSTQAGLATGSGASDGSGGGQPVTTRPQPGTGTSQMPVPSAGPSSSEGRKTTVAVLTDTPPDPNAQCSRPEALVLKERAQMAFEATVLRIEGNVVTLQVHHAWTGEADLVEVRNTTATPVLAGFEPEAGRKYLVAASDAQVMGCGYSGLDEPDLRAVYDEAFPKR